MTRQTDLHDGFVEWLSTRRAGSPEDPPRDLALHAAGCERCLAMATAVDLLSGIDVGGAPLPPLRSPVLGGEQRGVIRIARYAAVGVGLLVVGASVALGSNLLDEPRATNETVQLETFAEGVLAGVPSSSPSPVASPSPTPTRSESAPPSASPDVTEAPSEDPGAASTTAPRPTARPLPTTAPTAVPTTAPTATVEPTASPAATPPSPTLIASPTIPPVPTPSPSPVEPTVAPPP